jgi:pimeloyl-ACP methyl ester carboxylesterase
VILGFVCEIRTIRGDVLAVVVAVTCLVSLAACSQTPSDLSDYEITTSSLRYGTYRGEQVVLVDDDGTGLVFSYVLPGGGGDEPQSFVFLIHGLGASARIWYRDPFTHGGELAAALLELGYGIACFDLPYHGAHRLTAADRNTAIFAAGRYDQFVREVRGEVLLYQSYLRSLEDLELGRQYAVGYSLGAALALVLADEMALEAYVAAVPPLLRAVPGELTPWMSRSRLATPVLVIGAREDEAVGDLAYYDRFIASLATDDASLVWYDSGHSLPAKWVPAAIEWLGDR